MKIITSATPVMLASFLTLAASTAAAPDVPPVVAAESISETFTQDVIGHGWEVTNSRGDEQGKAEWIGEGGQDGGVLHLLSGELRSPPIPVEIRDVPPDKRIPEDPPLPGFVKGGLEPGIYRVTVRVRAKGTPERCHCPYAGKGSHHGIVHMRFYDDGGGPAPGSWFSRSIVDEEWQEISFTAMAPQWTRRARVAVIAHPGCSIEVDTLSFALDRKATAEFDRSRPTILYRPQPERWGHLPRTMDALQEGRAWRVVVLGDSIANDLYHSFFHRYVNAMYPGAKMQLIQSVHGSAGWDFFLKAGDDGDKDRVQSFVFKHEPDLLVIAGMSNRDVEDLRELVRRVREGCDAEILAVTAAVCQAHYRDSLSPPAEGTVYPVTERSKLGGAMVEAGATDRFAVFDMGRTWDAFLWNETRPLEWYVRDTSHLNPRGMAVVGRIMAGFFQPLDCTGTGAPVEIVQSEEPRQAKPEAGNPDAGEPDQHARNAADMPIVANVVARIVRVSPLQTVEEVAPYADAFRAVEYTVEQRLDGAVRKGAKIVVIQQVLADRKPTPAAKFAPDDSHRLKLSLWKHYRDHETWPVSDTLENYDARLYYALEARLADDLPAVDSQ